MNFAETMVGLCGSGCYMTDVCVSFPGPQVQFLTFWMHFTFSVLPFQMLLFLYICHNLKFLHTGQVFLYSPSFPKTLFRVLLVLKSSLSHIIGTLFSERQSNFFTEMHALLICLSDLHQLLYHCIAAARIQVL